MRECHSRAATCLCLSCLLLHLAPGAWGSLNLAVDFMSLPRDWFANSRFISSVFQQLTTSVFAVNSVLQQSAVNGLFAVVFLSVILASSMQSFSGEEYAFRCRICNTSFKRVGGGSPSITGRVISPPPYPSLRLYTNLNSFSEILHCTISVLLGTSKCLFGTSKCLCFANIYSAHFFTTG